MAIHPEFPRSPYSELLPEQRWFPAAEELRTTAYEKLLPPLVAKIRTEVATWRHAGYAKASDTSRALLTWWFETEHLLEGADGMSPHSTIHDDVGRDQEKISGERRASLTKFMEIAPRDEQRQDFGLVRTGDHRDHIARPFLIEVAGRYLFQ